MKIYTRKGDKGTTQLIGGTRVSKAHIRIDAYGTVDELNSCMGIVVEYITDQVLHKYLLQIQSDLFNLGALLAADPDKNTLPLPKITDQEVSEIEQWIDRLQAQLPELKNFILPGGNIGSAHCHVARCVCRRAERCVVQLGEHFPIEEVWLHYLNRLSDFLFVVARFISKVHGSEELLWKSR